MLDAACCVVQALPSQTATAPEPAPPTCAIITLQARSPRLSQQHRVGDDQGWFGYSAAVISIGCSQIIQAFIRRSRNRSESQDSDLPAR